MSNRIIKFRAYHKRLKKMVQPNQYFGKCNDHNTAFVLMQFTGIKDSSGVEIYEGDIILQKSNPDWHSKVEEKFVIEFGYQDLGHSSYQQTIGWNASSIRCYFNENSSLRKGIRDLCIKHPGITAIVIGNIHENPELLNG